MKRGRRERECHWVQRGRGDKERKMARVPSRWARALDATPSPPTIPSTILLAPLYRPAMDSHCIKKPASNHASLLPARWATNSMKAESNWDHLPSVYASRAQSLCCSSGTADAISTLRLLPPPIHFPTSSHVFQHPLA